MNVDSESSGGHLEPCAKCGDETAVGSPRFSDRRESALPTGSTGYLCAECIAGIRATGHFEGLSDERMVEVWAAYMTGGWF